MFVSHCLVKCQELLIDLLYYILAWLESVCDCSNENSMYWLCSSTAYILYGFKYFSIGADRKSVV